MLKLKRLKAGSYETLDSKYILYSYEAEDGTGTWWVAYKRTSQHDEWDEQVSVCDKLKGLKIDVANDMKRSQ